MVKMHGKDFTDIYPLFTPEKYATTSKDRLFDAVFSDNRLLCEKCLLEPYLHCKYEGPNISKDLAELTEVPEIEIDLKKGNELFRLV